MRGTVCAVSIWNWIRGLFGSKPDLYDEVEETPCGHQLGGHPHIIQNPMAEQCELVSRGAYLGGRRSILHWKTGSQCT